jgi:hypothetical protein
MKKPSKLELQLLQKAERGQLSDQDVAHALGFKNRQAAAGRLWRIHKFVKSNESKPTR